MRCDGCAVELLFDSLFCHACGRPVAGAASVPVPQGERKPLTVLFVETFGSIELGQRLDVEQWHEIVARFFAVVQESVARFGGTVDRLTGEGIKVLFGAPTALESHARQACHAALHLARELARLGETFCDRAGITFPVRMGLSSGEVVFGPVGGAAGARFTSQGHTAALAARMLDLASPGRIFLTESTAREVEGFFDLAKIGPMPVRGARDEVVVYELLRARDDRSRLDVARERGLTRFIGRAAEMAALEAALRLAQRKGHLVVGVAGEPGVGKSRLCDEFVRRQRERGIRVHAVRCLEHGRWLPFHTTLAYLRRELEIDDTQPAAAQREQIAVRLHALDPSLEDTLPALYSILGLAVPGDRRAVGGRPARELARVVRRLVEATTPETGAVVVIDDQHWMDPGSEATFGTLVAEPPHGPVLVVISYRRGHQRDWMRDPTFTEHVLQPLDQAATLELLTELLGDDPSLRDVAQRIADRAAGNPFFVEEIVRSLVESQVLTGRPGAYRLARDVSEVAVPTSLHAVLAARIDQLGPAEKYALQAASIIGREFSASLLAPLTGYDPPRLTGILRHLEATDFVSSLGSGKGLDYVFRHPLLCETAYRSLLSEPRAELHRKLARELHHTQGGRAAQVALHYEAAGDRLEAAHWHRQAAIDSERWEPVQALAHWRHVWACTARRDDEETLRLRLAACESIVRLGIHQTLGTDEARALLEEGRALAEALAEPRTTAHLLSIQGALLGAEGDLVGALACNARALEIARQTGDVELASLCGARLALTHRRAGNLRAGLEAADAAVQLSDAAPPSARPRLARYRAMLARIVSLVELGGLRTAESELHHVTAAFRREGESMSLAWALTMAARLIRFTGDASPSLVVQVEKGFSLARRLGVPSLLARAGTSLALARLFQNVPKEALALAREASNSIACGGAAFYADLDPLLVVAYAQELLGELDEAREAASQALRAALERRCVPAQMDALLCLGRVLLAFHEPWADEEARRLLVNGLVLVRRSRARSREPHLWLELARYARRHGAEARSRAYQLRAIRLLLAIDAMGHMRRAARGLAQDHGAAVLLHGSSGAGRPA